MNPLNARTGFTSKIARWNRGHSAARELRTLDDRQLADIGLDRIRLNTLFGNVTRVGGFPV